MVVNQNLVQQNNDSARILRLEAELAETKKKLQATEERLSILLESTPGGVLSYDADTGKLDYISPGTLQIFHCTEEQFRERYYNCFDLIISKIDRARVKQQIKDQLNYFDSVELTYRVEDILDNIMWIYHRGRLVTDENGKKTFLVVISDITDEKLVQNQINRNAQKLMEKAELDGMTSLYNKVSMQAAVEECISTSGVGSCHAMLMIDTDNFKSVNDTFGHQYGDKIITFVADSIRKIFRGTDFVGRVGGDEFMVFMRHTSRHITEERARQLNDAIRRDLREDDKLVSISCSIGIAFFSQDGDTYQKLFAAADDALYKAKEAGKNCYKIYEK